MRILVAGGSGFVGSQLIPALQAAGHEVRCFDLVVNPDLTEITVQGDVRDLDAYTKAATGFDAIVNLAAAHRDDVRPIELYEQTNVDGARNTVEVAKTCGIERIVFTSSVAVYGLDSGTSTEEDEPRPFNEYGRTKLAAEEIYRAWQQEHGGTLCIVRPCVIFGEGNRGNVYTLMKQIASGRFFIVGDGHNRKSMAYIGNIVAFLVHQITQAEGYSLVNYADKPDLTTNALVKTIRDSLGRHRWQNVRVPLWLGLAGGYAFDALARITGKTLPISSVRVRKFAASTIAGTARLDDSGFTRPYTIEDGLRRTVRAEFGVEA